MAHLSEPLDIRVTGPVITQLHHLAFLLLDVDLTKQVKKNKKPPSHLSEEVVDILVVDFSE